MSVFDQFFKLLPAKATIHILGIDFDFVGQIFARDDRHIILVDEYMSMYLIDADAIEAVEYVVEGVVEIIAPKEE